MKPFRIIFVCAIVFMIMAFTSRAQVDQQNYEKITVRSAETNNGVVIVKVATETGAIELQCNKDDPSCIVLKPEKYSMVRLPKNWGRYECANVEVYETTGEAENRSAILGTYCLIDK
jgi:hypothetical protein